METNNVSNAVYYVTKEGSDSNSGRSISRAFGSLRYACDHISMLSGADAILQRIQLQSILKQVSMKRHFPIIVPEFVSLVGDNLRTSMISSKAVLLTPILKI